MSYLFELSPLEDAGATLVSEVGHALQHAVSEERKLKKLTKQKIATTLGVHRSHVHRMLSGHYNLTLISLAELAYAIGREVRVSLEKTQQERGCNFHPDDAFWNSDEEGSAIADLKKSRKVSSDHIVMYEYQNG
ncbi:helix-turn-helix transcriptional regulator [Ochrobactrum sp. GRS2]|nr:helix-turn-helix transcriptional regulator [Ochrobactrum sp. GRS2]